MFDSVKETLVRRRYDGILDSVRTFVSLPYNWREIFRSQGYDIAVFMFIPVSSYKYFVSELFCNSFDSSEGYDFLLKEHGWDFVRDVMSSSGYKSWVKGGLIK